MIKLLAAVLILGANIYVYHFMAREAVLPPREDFSSFPMTLGSWDCLGSQSIDEETLENLGATDYMVCEFRSTSSTVPVVVYVGYHATQVREEGGGAGENSIHPPAHCLPGSGWDIIQSGNVPLDYPGFPVEAPLVKRLIVAKGQERQLTYYWYQSRGRVIAEDWQKVVFVGWDRARRSRTDGSLVRFTIPIVRGDEEAAERAFQELAPQIVEHLGRYVPV